ncbi:MAG TPA: CapA family protein [Acidimicrobiales bacterium]|nr:CapA family protein [Acidimicrobiales bacterium]
MRNRPLLLVLVVAGLASTSADPPIIPTAAADAAPIPARSATRAASPSATTSTVEPSVVPISATAQQVTLAFAGDVRFGGELARRLEDDPGTALAAVAPLLREADVTVVNLETAITERGTPAPKQFTFRAAATALDALRGAGVDVANMANNHGLDYGPESLTDALTASAERGFPLIGIGATEDEAYQPFVTEVHGYRIAVLGATQVLDSVLVEPWTAIGEHGGLASAKRVDRLVAEVETSRAVADVVVVFLHWGVELDTCPTVSQQTLARRLVAAGADVIVGGHSHRLQGAGRLDEALVAYGLGNFAFSALSAEGARSGVLEVTLTGRRVDDYRWRPARISSGMPVPLEAEEAAEEVAAWEHLRACTGLAR